MTFREYLKTRKNEKSAMGDLAWDILRDKNLANVSDDKLTQDFLLEYLKWYEESNKGILRRVKQHFKNYSRILCA